MSKRVAKDIVLNEAKEEPELDEDGNQNSIVKSRGRKDFALNIKVKDLDLDVIKQNNTHAESSPISQSSHKTEAESIHEYLTALESQSEQQLQAIKSNTIDDIETIQLHSARQQSRSRLPLLCLKDQRRHEMETLSNCGSQSSPPPSYRSNGSKDSLSTARESIHSNQSSLSMKEHIAIMTMELNDKTKTIALLNAVRKKDKVKTAQILADKDKKYQVEIKFLQEKYEKEIEELMTFTQTLIQEKEKLTKQCKELMLDLQKVNDHASKESQRIKQEIKQAKDRWIAQEKGRKDLWMKQKIEEIKQNTVRALEPDIQAILDKGKKEMEMYKISVEEEKRVYMKQAELNQEKALQGLREEYEKKLLTSREKEREKLITRLDAADAQVQEQLLTQRRRLMDEVETTRKELLDDIRKIQIQHTNEIQDMRTQETQRNGILVAKYEHEIQVLKEQCAIQTTQLKAKYESEYEDKYETYKKQLAIENQQEIEKIKTTIEKEMIQSRDAKIEMIIEKLQAESHQLLQQTETTLKSKWKEERMEYERKLKQNIAIETIWMEKNTSLHERIKELEQMIQELHQEVDTTRENLSKQKQEITTLKQIHTNEKQQFMLDKEQMNRILNDVKNDTRKQQKILQDELQQIKDQYQQKQVDYEIERKQLLNDHEIALASLHERIRQSMTKKDQIITTLQEDVRILEVKLEKSRVLLEEQRQQLFAE